MHRNSHLASDEGFALVTVIGAMALITVIAISGFFIAQNTLGESLRVSDENRAYQAASSALDQELSVFTPESLVTGVSPSGYSYDTSRTINGSDWYVVSVHDSADDSSLGADEYEMVALGGSGGTTETVRVRFQSFNLWDMNISAGENSGMGSGAGFNGNGTIIGKVYSNGNFDWSGNGRLEDGPVFVRNGVFTKQSSGSNVGYPTDYVDAYMDNPPAGQTNGMYATLKGTAPKLDIPFPTEADMDNWRQMAISSAAANKLGDNGVWTGGATAPRHPGSVSDAQYTVFDNDITIGTASFGKTGTTGVPVVESESADVIAFDASQGTLYLNGIVYCDGTVTISNAVNNYVGKGVIVAHDGVVIDGRLVPRPFAFGALDSYDTHSSGERLPRTSTNDCLAIVSMGQVTQRVSDWVAGMIFTNGAYVATPTGAKFRGSIISNGINFNQPNVWLVTQTGMADNRPDGMPALNNMNAQGDWIRR